LPEDWERIRAIALTLYDRYPADPQISLVHAEVFSYENIACISCNIMYLRVIGKRARPVISTLVIEKKYRMWELDHQPAL